MAPRRPLVVVDGSAREIAAGDVLPDDIQTVSAPAWAASTSYRAGDLVWQAGALYRRITAGTSGASFDSSAWDMIGPSGGSGGTDSRYTIASPRVGEWLVGGSGANPPGSRIPNGELRLTWHFLPPGTYDAVSFHVWDTGTAGAVIKVIAYADSSGTPSGVPLLDTATVDGTTSGFKLLTGLSLVVGPGGRIVWAGTVSQGAPSTMPGIAGTSPASNQYVGVGATPALGYVLNTALVATGVTNVAPNSPTVNRAEVAASRVAFRRSA